MKQVVKSHKPVPTRRASSRQEKKVARTLNGKVQSNSGATDFQKGDVVTEKMLIECKTVMKPQASVSIKKEWFEKNEIERFAMRKDYSALVFDFGDGDNQYIAMDLKTFKNILEDNKNEEIN